ncbi:hypothetical protein SLS63_010355 [Diaporthe eres]|uniref:Ubiquitin-like domain-containing protein n=1 Tax=Diaporthe eres TaxID=83184 RepID=A0ABR1NX33_DIAER
MEAIGATASIVGIVSFGLGLAKSLQAFIDSVIEAEETITLIVAEVNATASTLKRLQDFIDQDKTTSEEEHRATVFNGTGIREIAVCALQCQKIYVQIIILIEGASMQAGEDEGKDTETHIPIADELNKPTARLEAFSKNVFLIAESRTRASVARILGTDDENEMRDRAETLRKKMTQMQAKTSPPKQSNRQPPGSDNGTSEEADASGSTSNTSTTSVISSSSSEARPDSPASSSSSSLISEPVRGSRRPRRLRVSRALRTFRALKAQIRKRTERKSIFKKDSVSVMFEAYLIYPVPGPFPGNSSPPPMKLPFGHRRLTREVKRALRKFNPWDILLILSPQHRVLVDRVVRHVQRAATSTNVCLVAIDVDGHVDVDGHSDVDISDLEAGDLVWNRMVLFFRYEAARARKGTTEAERDAIGGRSDFTATIRNIFLGSRRKNKKRLEVQESADPQRREDDRIAEDERMRVEFQDRVEAEVAKREAQTRAREEEERLSRQRQEDHDRRVANEARSSLLDAQREEEREERRRQEEREELKRQVRDAITLEMRARQQQEGQDQALKDADAPLEDVEKGIGEGELEMPEPEHAKKILENEDAEVRFKMERADPEHAEKILEDERAAVKARMEKAEAENAKPPVAFRDAIGRKFNFPFHLVQTWEGIEDLIKQAFVHVEVIGPRVQEGHYDLMDSEGQVILPSLWSVAIKPGETVSMRMWPDNKQPLPGPQHMSPEQRMNLETARRRHFAAPQPRGGYLGATHPGGLVQRMPPPPDFPRDAFVGRHPPPPPPPRMRQFPPTGGEGGWPAMVDIVEGGQPKTKRRAKKNVGFVSRSKPGKNSGKDKHRHPKPKVVESRVEDSEETDKGENVEDIDKELGLDDLDGAEMMAAKDIDELIESWTNSARNEEGDEVLD